MQARGLWHLVLPGVDERGIEGYKGSALVWRGLTFCLSLAPSVGGPLISDKWTLGKIKGSSGRSSSGDLSAVWFCVWKQKGQFCLRCHQNAACVAWEPRRLGVWTCPMRAISQ